MPIRSTIVTAAMGIRSRILWIIGRADDAMVAAEECLARGLAVDHAQSLCWAITFNLCPVAIWSGDTENANRFTAIAMAHSEKTFEHWNEWAKMYRTALDNPERRRDRGAVTRPDDPGAEGYLCYTMAKLRR